MTSKVIYKGDLRTEATHVKSGTSIITDAPVDNHGKGTTFSPTDLVATALGSCMMTIMGIAANKHDINMDGVALEVTKIMESNPRRIGKVEIVLTMPAHDYTSRERKLLTAAANGCPVAETLKDGVLDLTIVWGDDK